MKKIKYFVLVVLFCLNFYCFSSAEVPLENTTSSTDNKTSKDVVVKTVEGLRFSVPEDMPIQKKDGIIAPMKSDQYVAMKFSNLESRLQMIEKAITKINEDLSLVQKSLDSIKKPPAFMSGANQDNLPSLKDLKE
jgi:hypothetical protein